MRNIDLKKEKQKIIHFIKTYFKNAGFSKGIIGLSGKDNADLLEPFADFIVQSIDNIKVI